jgi:hypothetical protein
MTVFDQWTGSFPVEDVEDAHPQHEDAIVEVDISGMPVSPPKTIVIPGVSANQFRQP